MPFKNSYYAVLIALFVTITPTTQLSAADTYLTKKPLIAGSALAGLGWMYFQRKHSLLGIQRYPFMQRRGILTALIKKEHDLEKQQALEAELATINAKLAEFENKHTDYTAAKYTLLAIALASGTGAHFSK